MKHLFQNFLLGILLGVAVILTIQATNTDHFSWQGVAGGFSYVWFVIGVRGFEPK